MAKINRYDGNLKAFAADALGTERTIFGDTEQSNTLDGNITSDFFRGWGIVGVNENPKKQDFNGLAFTLGQLISYLHQRGVPEWNTAQEYYEGSVVTTLAGIYRLKTGGVGSVDPDTDANVNWEKAPTRSDIVDSVIRVTSVAAIEAYSAPVGYVFSLNAGGRSGVFDVIAGDFSTELAADSLNGVYVGLADNPLATTKVAKRRISGQTNVKWFGALGDGTTDDTIPIQAAFNAITGARQSVYFPPGTYRVTATVNIDAEKVSGANSNGGGRIKVDGTGFSAFKVTGTIATGTGPTIPANQTKRLTEFFVLFTGLTFYGANYTVSGIEFERVMEPTVHNCRFFSMLSGIKLSVRNRNFICSSCHFWDNVYGIHWNRVNLHQQVITGCHIQTRSDGSTPEHALFFDGGDVHNLEVTACDIEGFGPCGALIKVLHNGDTVDGASSEQWSQVSICGCSIEAHFGNVESLISIETNDTDSVVALVQVTSNEFSGSTEPAIAFNSDSLTDGLSQAVVINSNTFLNIDNWAIYIDAVLSTASIVGNSIGQFTASLKSGGFLACGTNALIENLSVSSNTGSNLVLGAVRLSTRGTVANEINVIGNNFAFASSYGGSNISGYAYDIDLSGKTALAVRLSDNTARVRSYTENGMRVAASTFDKAIISNNIVRGDGYGFARYTTPTAVSGNIVEKDNI